MAKAKSGSAGSASRGSAKLRANRSNAPRNQLKSQPMTISEAARINKKRTSRNHKDGPRKVRPKSTPPRSAESHASSGYLTPEAAEIAVGSGVLGYVYNDGMDPDVFPDKLPEVVDLTDLEVEERNSGKTLDTTADDSEDFIGLDVEDSDAEEMASIKMNLAKQFEDYEHNIVSDAEKQRRLSGENLAIIDYHSPWLRRNRVEMPLNEQLNNEMYEFISYVSPSRREMTQRSDLISRIREVIRDLWPWARAEVFGSHPTNLYLPGADIDMVVTSRDGRLKTSNKMYSLSSQLRTRNISKRVEVIRRAKVPLVKFVDNASKLQVDISFEQQNGVPAIDTVVSWMHDTPALRPLVLVVKTFLKRRRLNDVAYGGVGGFATVCMVKFFLNRHPQIRDGSIEPTKNLGVLLVDFLRFYSEELDTSRHALSMVGDMPLLEKTRYPDLIGNNPGAISIQDPNDPTNNISRASSNYNAVRREFGHALDLFKRMAHEYSLLSPENRLSRSFLAPILKSHDGPRESRPQSSPIGEDAIKKILSDIPSMPRVSNIGPPQTGHPAAQPRQKQHPTQKQRTESRQRQQHDKRRNIPGGSNASDSDWEDTSFDERPHQASRQSNGNSNRNLKGNRNRNSNDKSKAADLFKADSTSESEPDAPRKRRRSSPSSDEGQQDSRIRATEQQKRSYWQQKATLQQLEQNGAKSAPTG